RHEVRQNLVVSRLWKRHIDRPGPIGLFFRMYMLEVLHILADDEQVILPFVNHFEFLDGLAATGMENSKQQLRPLPRLQNSRHGAKIESIIAVIERSRTDGKTALYD